jgi:tetratricopeptide (TPR) repeat protein
MQLIRKNYSKIDPELAAAFMGDHIQYPTGYERATQAVLGVADNVNSMVFSPEDLKFWVASGKAPVCNNRFIGFDFTAEMNGVPSVLEPAFLEGYQFLSHNKRRGMDKYIEALKLYEHDSSKVDEILDLLHEASQIDPTEPSHLRIIAKMLLHQKKYEEAIRQLQVALPLKQSLNEKAQNHLLLGILYDLTNQRQQALNNYQAIDSLVSQEGADPWFRINRILLAYKQKYEISPFSIKDMKDNTVLISFTQESGIE